MVCLLCEYAFMNIRHFINEIIIKPVKKIVFAKEKKLMDLDKENNDLNSVNIFKRKCKYAQLLLDTGFAFAEDVANIKELIDSIHEFHFK